MGFPQDNTNWPAPPAAETPSVPPADPRDLEIEELKRELASYQLREGQRTQAPAAAPAVVKELEKLTAEHIPDGAAAWLKELLVNVVERLAAAGL